MIKLIKKLFSMKRYFIVSYTFNTISKASGNGSICMYTRGFYASKQSIDQNVGYSDETKEIIVESIVINNIIELSKRDYYDYCSKH
jgi:hypothetical protein